MLALPARRRAPSSVQDLRPGEAADSVQVAYLRDLCIQADLTITPARELLLHGILRAGRNSTAVAIWKTLIRMVNGPAPNAGSIQRNLNAMTRKGILQRSAGPDRMFHYSLHSCPPQTADNESDGFILTYP